MDLHKTKHKVISAQLEHFWCQDEPRAIWIHKTYHGPDLGEATTFPFRVCFVLLHESHIQMTFCLGSPEIPKVGPPVTLGPHNFACKPPIEMRFKAKLQPLLRSFQRYVAFHLHIRKLGRFLTFNDQESNYQFDSRLFFWP